MNKSSATELKRISRLPVTIQAIELGALLTRLFEKQRIILTVVGGAAVQFYTQATYTTRDLDVILQGDDAKTVDEVMGSLGFVRTTTYRHFEHALFDFVVEFPPSPIEVGHRVIDRVNLIETASGSVRVIRIEDILMDRIVAGVEWKDTASLAQARLLWLTNKDEMDLAYLTQFAKQEGYAKILKEIMKASIASP